MFTTKTVHCVTCSSCGHSEWIANTSAIPVINDLLRRGWQLNLTDGFADPTYCPVCTHRAMQGLEQPHMDAEPVCGGGVYGKAWSAAPSNLADQSIPIDQVSIEGDSHAF